METFWAGNKHAALAEFFIIWETLVLKKNKSWGLGHWIFSLNLLALKTSIKFLLKQFFKEMSSHWPQEILIEGNLCHISAKLRENICGLLVGCYRFCKHGTLKVLGAQGALGSSVGATVLNIPSPYIQNWDCRTVHACSGPLALPWYASNLAWKMLIEEKTEKLHWTFITCG